MGLFEQIIQPAEEIGAIKETYPITETYAPRSPDSPLFSSLADTSTPEYSVPSSAIPTEDPTQTTKIETGTSGETSTGTTISTTPTTAGPIQQPTVPSPEPTEPTVTPIKTPDAGVFTGLGTAYWHAFNNLSDVESQANELNNPGTTIYGSDVTEERITELRRELGWKPEWKATVVNGELTPLKAAQDIKGSTEGVTNTKGQAWHTFGLANRSSWSGEGYANPLEILNDPNSLITKVRWVGDNSKLQLQQSKDFTKTTSGADTEYQFKDYMDDVFIVHDSKVGWRTVKGSQLLNPHHEVATPFTEQKEENVDPLNRYLKDQIVDPSIPTSGQQTYENIVTRPEDFLTENEKKIATDLNLSLTEAAKTKIINTAQGKYDDVDANDIESLKELVASTYSDNITTISDEQADNAEATAQFISSLDTIYSDLETGIEGATGTITERAEAAGRDTLQEQGALASEQADISVDQITAQTGTAEQIAAAGEVDAVTREVETINKAIDGSNTVIPDENIDAIFNETVPTASYEATTGAIRSGTAASVTGSEKVGDAVREIAQGTAAVDTLDDPKVVAAIAEMPQEALVSSQLELLLDSIESDEVPAWARPAVEQVEKVLAARGMGKSSVARDSLFNAIITAATPLAQSNAQALQTQALKNQENQQRSNELQANLNQDIRLANLSNRQAMEVENLRALNASQSEQFSFEAQQKLKEYETLINFKTTNAEYAQQMEQANLSSELQMELANLQHTNTANATNMSAENQSRLLELQTYVDFVNKNADFQQQMELANLDMEGKVAFANLSALNESNRDQMTVDQQTALTEYQTKVEVGKYNAELAQQMKLTNLSNEQQTAVQNAMNTLNMDLRKLDLDQQIVLANSSFLQTMTATDLSNRQQASILNATQMAAMDMANLSNLQKAQVTNAQNFLQMDLANLSNAQQSEVFNDQWNQQVLLSNQSVENAARQFASSAENDINKFIASMETSIEQTNSAQNAAMSQFNATEDNKTAALNQQNEQAVELFNANLRETITQFQEQVNFQRETFNASMEYQIDSSNVQWRRNMNTANTAGVNAVNQANAINAFNLSSDGMNKLWQELRDTASWEFQQGQTETASKAQMALAILGNESAEALTKLKINADSETSIGEGLSNIFMSILEGTSSLDNVTKFF